jgi:hypothetical protein
MSTTPAPLSQSTIAAAQDPTHAEHHFSLDQVLATVMLGSMDALTAYTNPAAIGSSITNFVNGFLQIWLPGSTQQAPRRYRQLISC